MAAGEFELIRRHFAHSAAAQTEHPAVALGIGDDCALLDIPANQQLALSIDTLVVDCHFPAEAPPHLLGWRALAVCLSDLAAMGAEPVAFTLALSLPSVDQSWLSSFSTGLSALARQSGCQLIGGDTTRGPLTISIQVHGLVPRGAALTRSGAQVGDHIVVSGDLGGAAAALSELSNATQQPLSTNLQRYYQPQPRWQLGQQLRPIATSAQDISDGLLADLGHICEASGVGAQIGMSSIPALHTGEAGLAWALSGGDDYELCFTVPVQHLAEIDRLAHELQLPLTDIGVIQTDPGVRLLNDNGEAVTGFGSGYNHF